MTMSISKFTSKVIGDKRRWREYKARTRQLPENYRAAVDAFERYLMYLGPADGDSAASMFEDLADLFEQSAADGTPIRAVVGKDPWSSSKRSSGTTRRGSGEAESGNG
jgi:DNA-binding ferritin-like protein (Dps family)